MPSTSVQIWISDAPRHAPTIAAEKSEPPRPSVVVTPVAVAPTNPPITGMRPAASGGSACVINAAVVSSNIGAAAVCSPSVTIALREST